jgi:hypothetical protein
MQENVALDELTLLSLMDHRHQKATTLSHTLTTRVLHSMCFYYSKNTTTMGVSTWLWTLLLTLMIYISWSY